MFNLSLSELILFGLGQTMFIILILLQKKFRQPQNLFLFCMFIILFILFYYSYLQNEMRISNEWFGVVKPILLLPPVLGFFYTQAVISGKFASKKAYYYHFLPSFIFSLLFIPILVYNISTEFVQFNFNKYNNYYVLIASELIVLSFLFYPIWIIRLLRQFYTIRGNDFIFQLLKINETKVRFINLLVALSLIQSIIFFFDVNSVFLFGNPTRLPELLTIVFLFLISYVFTVLFLLNPKIIRSAALSSLPGTKSKSSKSHIPNNQELNLLNILNFYMEKEKPYLDNNLNMSTLSEKIGIQGYLISEIINSILNQNFFDYINNYRIEEFKCLVQDPKNKNYKLLSLAYDAGFNSKSTFYKAFKKFSGQTPSEYLNSLP
jgi:AraC-like DNA-binding protein